MSTELRPLCPREDTKALKEENEKQERKVANSGSRWWLPLRVDEELRRGVVTPVPTEGADPVAPSPHPPSLESCPPVSLPTSKFRADPRTQKTETLELVY